MPAPRKPTAILKLVGSVKHDKKRYAVRDSEPVENAPLGPPPDRLQPTHRELWLELQGQLVEGVALASDRAPFERLVKLIAKDRYDNDLTGPEMAQMGRLFTTFGMGPADRSRVKAPKKAVAANPFGAVGS